MYTICIGTDRPQLRLILKVGGASTPDLVDHGDSSSGMSNRQSAANLHYGAEEDSRQSSLFSLQEGGEREKHKKKKEKKKKKNKDKDKEKKKHRHKVAYYIKSSKFVNLIVMIVCIGQKAERQG